MKIVVNNKELSVPVNQVFNIGHFCFTHSKDFTKDEDGNENLFSLKDKGVGALYLGSAVTPFELKANDGKLQGVMRESSVYLKENGKIGTLQELDLVV